MLNTQNSILNSQYSDYHNITAYQKAKQVTKLSISIANQLPKNRAFDAIYIQLVRSSSSIGANIAEGYGRNNPKEYKQFLGIARGSSLETEYWLEIINESAGIDTKPVLIINKEIIKLLTTSIKNISIHP